MFVENQQGTRANQGFLPEPEGERGGGGCPGNSKQRRCMTEKRPSLFGPM